MRFCWPWAAQSVAFCWQPEIGEHKVLHARVLDPPTCLCHFSYPLCPLSRVRLCRPMDRSSWAPLSMDFSRQEYWRGLLVPPPGDLPDPRIETPTLAGGFFTRRSTWEAPLLPRGESPSLPPASGLYLWLAKTRRMHPCGAAKFRSPGLQRPHHVHPESLGGLP